MRWAQRDSQQMRASAETLGPQTHGNILGGVGSLILTLGHPLPECKSGQASLSLSLSRSLCFQSQFSR